ncbi:hypothetical protein TELCIR_16046 [Teladorsagia circumcincta]|uniref:Uncharacterized protein n=1 Tax=Teladorsagia circumcincta TaxID=45464 RepID=A0A2G9TWJ9_TELCI|nr:hypothetical protein TELCIR_16046 [Teladorsagia circumcincta]
MDSMLLAGGGRSDDALVAAQDLEAVVELSLDDHAQEAAPAAVARLMADDRDQGAVPGAMIGLMGDELTQGAVPEAVTMHVVVSLEITTEAVIIVEDVAVPVQEITAIASMNVNVVVRDITNSAPPVGDSVVL